MRLVPLCCAYLSGECRRAMKECSSQSCSSDVRGCFDLKHGDSTSGDYLTRATCGCPDLLLRGHSGSTWFQTLLSEHRGRKKLNGVLTFVD